MEACAVIVYLRLSAMLCSFCFTVVSLSLRGHYILASRHAVKCGLERLRGRLDHHARTLVVSRGQGVAGLRRVGVFVNQLLRRGVDLLHFGRALELGWVEHLLTEAFLEQGGSLRLPHAVGLLVNQL